LQDTVIILR